MVTRAFNIHAVIFLKDPPSFLAFVLGQITIPGNTPLFGHSLHRSSGAHMLGAREAPGGDPRIPRIPPWIRLCLGLRTMLRCVTDPNHVDSSAAYAFILGILRRKGNKWKMSNILCLT